MGLSKHSVDSDQMPQKVASDQGPHSLQLIWQSRLDALTGNSMDLFEF